MRRPVPSHPYTRGFVPALEAFEPLIERTDNHWWWEGDFKKFDCDNFAVFRASIPPRGRLSGLYVVVRALWVFANPSDLADRLSLNNTCGYVACVNPAHVEREARPSDVTLVPDAQMHDGVRVRLLQCNQRVHIVPMDVAHAVCGWRMRTMHAVAANAPITCTECVSTWRARGYPLQEVAHVS